MYNGINLYHRLMWLLFGGKFFCVGVDSSIIVALDDDVMCAPDGAGII